MEQQTAVDTFFKDVFDLYESYLNGKIELGTFFIKLLEHRYKAKQMEKEQMIKFAEFVASHPDKNKNYLGEMLHAKSKYDGSERTIDLLEQYYNKTYNK